MLGLIADEIRRNAEAAYLRYRAASAEQHRNAEQFNGFEGIGKSYPNTSRYGNQRTCTVNDLEKRTVDYKSSANRFLLALLWRAVLTLCEMLF